MYKSNNMTVRLDVTQRSIYKGHDSDSTNINISNVRHPRCVLYNSKGLGMLTLKVEHNYICF